MFKMSEWLHNRTANVRSTKQKALIAIAGQLGSVIVVVATFTLGYVVKNMEVSGEQRMFSETISKQRDSYLAECNARIIQQDRLADQRMHERDLLLADQTGRLADQTLLIQTLQRSVDTVVSRQQQGLLQRKAELHVVTRAATKAEAAATVAVNVVKKGLTDDDRRQINAAAKETKK